VKLFMHVRAILIEILLVIILMIANGIFSMSEMAIISARRARLQQLARKGDRRAEVALALAASPDRLLSTVQIGITLIGILAGAVGGATIAEQLGLFLQQIPALAGSAEMIGVGIVVIGITYLSLIIGELVPKRMALSSPEKIAMAIALPMNWIARLATPLVRLLDISTTAVFSILRLKADTTPSITEEEIKILLEEGTQSGIFNEAEESLVRNIFRLADQRISTLMTPRLRMEWLNINDPPELNLQRVINSPHTIFPIARGSADEILGLIRGKDLLATLIELTPGPGRSPWPWSLTSTERSRG
jgi:putative hemolysin